jgi:hypothetical protein
MQATDLTHLAARQGTLEKEDLDVERPSLIKPPGKP